MIKKEEKYQIIQEYKDQQRKIWFKRINRFVGYFLLNVLVGGFVGMVIAPKQYDGSYGWLFVPVMMSISWFWRSLL